MKITALRSSIQARPRPKAEGAAEGRSKMLKIAAFLVNGLRLEVFFSRFHEAVLGVDVLRCRRTQEAEKCLRGRFVPRSLSMPTTWVGVVPEAVLVGKRDRLNLSAATEGRQHLGLPHHPRVRLVRQDAVGCLTVVDGREPVVRRGLAVHALLAARYGLPDAVPLQHLANVELHDALVDRVRHRGATVRAR